MPTNPARKPLTIAGVSHFFTMQNITNTATRPPVHAASVVFIATRPAPALSMIESVEQGLKPYQPNQRIRPPMTAIVRSCGGIGPPPSRLNLRPSLGPSMMAPAIATHPPIECTTVEPAQSWKFIPRPDRQLPAEPMGARKPAGPQHQWPRIG